MLRTLFQLTYTTLFGAYATFLYLRTGSLLAVVLVHAFCNWMGLPRFWGRVEGEVALLGGEAESKRDDGKATVEVADGRLGIGWTVAYYVLLVAGAVGWYKGLWVLTSSPSALVPFP